MLKTSSPVMEALLDATLEGDNRRLLLVGDKGSMMAMIRFQPDSIKLLEGQLADAKKQVADIELALALSRVGHRLKVEITEE